MNKLLQTALITSILSTGTMAAAEDPTLIDGPQIIKKNGTYNVQNTDCVLTGTIEIATGTGTTGTIKPGKLIIGENRKLTVKGGTITYTGAETAPGLIQIAGTMNVTLGEKRPTLKFGALAMEYITIDGTGTLDLSSLRELPEDDSAKNPDDWSGNIVMVNLLAPDKTELYDVMGKVTVKLPFNCKFTKMDLSGAKKVYYTRLSVGGKSEPGLEDKVIKRVYVEGNEPHLYGAYADDESLGVTLPNADHLDITTVSRDEERDTLKLSVIAENTAFNKVGYALYTTDLDDPTHVLSEDTTYCFGFIGTQAISVRGEYKAIFEGNNSDYKTSDNSLELPSNVEFAGNDSLFPITQTYGRGTFTAGGLSNTVPKGKTVTFSNGFSLGAGHTLTVEGSLIV